MKNIRLIFIALIIALPGLYCANNNSEKKPDPRTISSEFKSYWYNNDAELTSYDIVQARYGELHEGKSVLIYVTEPFNSQEQVKADAERPENISVLKLNNTRKFYTGVYPYSMMTSVFQPIAEKGHAMKVNSSSQDWCGHTFMQLNNRSEFKFEGFSYFQSEGDIKIDLEPSWLEDEIWTLLRIDPKELPIGKIHIIPSFFDIRLRHRDKKIYTAEATNKIENSIGKYEITYVDIKRKLAIYYTPQFPYSINGWEEETESGFGENTKTLKTKATKIATLKIDYWNKNSVKDSIYKSLLGL